MTQEKLKTPDREGAFEKGSRWYRNFNGAVGAIALVGAGVVASPAGSAALAAYGWFNVAQAGAGEVGRRWAKKRRAQKNRPKDN